MAANRYALALQQYFQQSDEETYARLGTRGITEADGGATVNVIVEVDLPQRCANDVDIRPEEEFDVFFPADGQLPTITPTRIDFPIVPHTNLVKKGEQPSLCLYSRPWSEERLHWGPLAFVERIRTWLSDTAKGSLHRPDQPMEPLLAESPYCFVIPEIPARAEACWVQPLRMTTYAEAGGLKTVSFSLDRPGNRRSVKRLFLCFRCPPATHGIIKYSPRTLGELLQMLGMTGVEFGREVCSHLKDLDGSKEENAHLGFLLLIPKSRHEGEEPASTERWAFLSHDSMEQIMTALKAPEGRSAEGIFVPRLMDATATEAFLRTQEIFPVTVRDQLTRATAALANGEDPSDIQITCIGMGAFGSQVATNLIRGGYGQWTLVDGDIFLPHNGTRHFLTAEHAGWSKAEAMCAALEAMLPGEENVAVGIHADFLDAKGETSDKVSNALSNSQLVLDFSASVSVERNLSRRAIEGRCISAFLNPSGKDLVMLIEDDKRVVPLSWLEAVYLGAVATNNDLDEHFDQHQLENTWRYGNSCRDTSAVLPQDLLALHSAIASRRIRRINTFADALIVVHRTNDETLTTRAVEIKPRPPVSVSTTNWELLIAPEVLESARKLRHERLPNETGGVLLGVADLFHRCISVVQLLSAPPDSKEYPSYFIRGAAGLRAEIDRRSRRSLGNLIYLGEWHSHPSNHSSNPSSVDLEAASALAPIMARDGLPTCILIAGEKDDFSLLFKAPDRTDWDILAIGSSAVQSEFVAECAVIESR